MKDVLHGRRNLAANRKSDGTINEFVLRLLSNFQKISKYETRSQNRLVM